MAASSSHAYVTNFRFLPDEAADGHDRHQRVVSTPSPRSPVLSAPNAVCLPQGLVNRPTTQRSGWEVRGVAGFELEAAAVLGDKRRATLHEVTKFRIDYGACERTGRGLPGACLDGTVRRCPGFDAAQSRPR